MCSCHLKLGSSNHTVCKKHHNIQCHSLAVANCMQVIKTNVVFPYTPISILTLHPRYLLHVVTFRKDPSLLRHLFNYILTLHPRYLLHSHEGFLHPTQNHHILELPLQAYFLKLHGQVFWGCGRPGGVGRCWPASWLPSCTIVVTCFTAIDCY